MSEKNTRAAGFSTHHPSADRTGRSFFFGIGINQYQHFDPLHNAVKDVSDVVTLLEERYEIDEKIVLLNEEATEDNITNHLEKLIDLTKPADKVIIYYSGHGFLREETGYWIPVDAQPNLRGQFIRNEVIRGCIKDIKARHILLISDSCFSGSLVVRDIANPDPNLAIAELEKDQSRWVLSSGRDTEKVADGTPGENSPFAKSILKVLRDNQEPMLNVAVLADRVKKLTRYNWAQMPQGSPLFRAGHEGGEYVFRLKNLTPGWQTAWERIESQPESTIHEINAKIHEIFEYTGKFEFAENIEEAYKRGKYLEDKCAFLKAKSSSSLFDLQQFARRNTPFQEEAQQLIEEMKKGLHVSPESVSSVISEPKVPKSTEDSPLPEKPTIQKRTPKEIKPTADGETGQFTDPRDGQTYKTIRLNGKTWMAQNLNFDAGDGCWFYDNDPKNGEKYGRLYTWEAAKKACPPGWRLPTDEEWSALINYYGGMKKAKKVLFNDGTSGFAALLGGRRDPSGSFNGLGSSGYYWSGTEKGAQGAWYYYFYSDLGKLYRFYHVKTCGFSCRCLQGE